MKILLSCFVFVVSTLAFAEDPQPKCDGCPPPLCYPGTQCCFVMPKPGEPPQNKPCCYLCEVGQTRFTVNKKLPDPEMVKAIALVKAYETTKR